MLRLFYQLFFLPVLAMVILYAFMAQVLPLRRGWRWRIPITLAVMALASMLKVCWGIFSWQSFLIRLAAFPVAMVILPLWIFQGPVWKRLVVNTLLYCAQMLGEALCVQLFIPLNIAANVDAFYLQMSVPQLLLYGALSQGATVIMDCVIVVFARSFTARRFSAIYLPVLFLPLCLWGMLLGHYLNFPSWVWVLCMLLGGGATVILLYYIVSLEEKDILREQVRELRHAMELEQAHYRLVEERREELARIRHDFNNHLSAIGRLVAGGELEDAQRMVTLLRENIAATWETPFCDIPVVNAVLEEKARLCRERGVGLRVALELPENLAVEPLHLCSIFANLVDNAIHGAEVSDQEAPEVTLTSKVDGDYLFIKTTNPGAAPSGGKNEAPAAGRGYGVRICDNLAGRYGGAYQRTFHAGVYTALVSLLVTGGTGLGDAFPGELWESGGLAQNEYEVLGARRSQDRKSVV